MVKNNAAECCRRLGYDSVSAFRRPGTIWVMLVSMIVGDESMCNDQAPVKADRDTVHCRSINEDCDCDCDCDSDSGCNCNCDC